MLGSLVLIAIMLFSASTTAFAGTLINVNGKDNATTRIMTDGKQARMDMGKDGSYMLIDYEKQSVYAVLPAQQQIMDMSGDLPAMSSGTAQNVNTELTPGGNGPTIAGYATREFSLKANGVYCGVLYGSKDAMQDSDINQLFDAMKNMLDKQRAAMGGYAAMVDVCTRASMDFSSISGNVGVPMKMLDKNGNHVSEIISITTGATLPADTFVLPQGYKVTSIAETVQQTRQAMQPLQQQMPQIQNMLQQMQQQGGLPPEAMEQLQRYQQMQQQ